MIKKILLYLIDFYGAYKRKYLKHKMGCCRFYPTCSRYAYQAIDKYGAIKGVYLSVKRVLRCHPFSKGGYDPLK